MTIDRKMQNAAAHHNAGRLADAEKGYRQVLMQNPNHADALHLLGVIAAQTGKPQVAIDWIHRAIAIDPNQAMFHMNLANALVESGRREEAAESFAKSLRLDPNDAMTLTNFGNLLRDTGRLPEAVAVYQHALRVRPGDMNTLYNLGDALVDQERFADAVPIFRQVIRFQPNHADAHHHLGNALRELKQFDEAITAAQRATELKPDSDEAHANLGNVYRDMKDHDRAIVCYRRAVELNPNLAIAVNNLGCALRDAGRLEESIPLYERAIQLDPALINVYSNLGSALHDQAQFGRSMDCYRAAIQRDPKDSDANWNLALSYLLLGDLEQGFRGYESRWSRKQDTPPLVFVQPKWNGESLVGKRILLHPEQGFGDTIQFIRYAPLITERGGNVAVLTHPELYRLLKNMDGVEQVLQSGETPPSFDFHCPIMTLPLMFGTRLESVPANVPYLKPDPKVAAAWKERLGPSNGRLRVGLVWAGRPEHKNDRNRSMSLAKLAPLAAVKNVTFYSLQKGPASAQAATPPAGMELIDFTSELNDFADTAALISQLDLVIAVDTAVVHLTGAIGKPAWVLLPVVPDWRWLLDRDDNPWYPKTRLFRQKNFGDWEEVVQRVAAALATRTLNGER
jgi:tetratricopeptide (TPR) repeat protein